MKERFNEESMRVADKMIKRIEEEENDVKEKDCKMEDMRIKEGMGRKANKTVVLLHRAYGMGGG